MAKDEREVAGKVAEDNGETDVKADVVETIDVMKKELMLASRPQGLPTDANFTVFESKFTYTRPLQEEKAVVLKVLMISIDPYLREIMNEESEFTGIPPLEIGKPVKTFSVSKVLSSSVPEFEQEDYAVGITPVTDYVLMRLGPNTLLKKIMHEGVDIPLGHYLGVLGMPGYTAWLGLNKIAHLQANEEIYISAAAGAVGLVAGQLAKLKGCRVVGSAGSDEKVKKLKEVYKYDDAFNYKTEQDWVAALKKRFPNGFDVYFENVGGRMLEAVLEMLRKNGRIVACGMVSQYNKKASEREGVRNLVLMTGKSLKMKGFLVSDFPNTWDAFFEEMSQYLQEGKINYQTEVLGEGIEEFAKALAGLLKGENFGKAVLCVNKE